MTDTWAARLVESIKNYRAWPHFFTKVPTLQCKPVDTDSDIAFYSDYRYLEELQAALLDECRLAKREVGEDMFTAFVVEPLLEMVRVVPCEPPALPEWPVDVAQHLITMWKYDIELRDWMDGAAA